jgi:hypothetical protein
MDQPPEKDQTPGQPLTVNSTSNQDANLTVLLDLCIMVSFATTQSP